VTNATCKLRRTGEIEKWKQEDCCLFEANLIYIASLNSILSIEWDSVPFFKSHNTKKKNEWKPIKLRIGIKNFWTDEASCFLRLYNLMICRYNHFSNLFLVLSEFPIMNPNPIHLPFSSYPLSSFATSLNLGKKSLIAESVMYHILLSTFLCFQMFIQMSTWSDTWPLASATLSIVEPQ